MTDELDWRIRVRRASRRHEAALEAADVVFSDVEEEMDRYVLAEGDMK